MVSELLSIAGLEAQYVDPNIQFMGTIGLCILLTYETYSLIKYLTIRLTEKR